MDEDVSEEAMERLKKALHREHNRAKSNSISQMRFVGLDFKLIYNFPLFLSSYFCNYMNIISKS
jgi:hypothetical protein